MSMLAMVFTSTTILQAFFLSTRGNDILTVVTKGQSQKKAHL